MTKDARGIIFIVGLAIYAAFTVPFVIVVAPSMINDARVQSSFHLYPSAVHIASDEATYGGGSAKKSSYFWSEAPLNEVQVYYEQFFARFIHVPDDYGEYLATLYSLDELERERNQPTTSDLTCDYLERYTCISLALVDAGQANIYELPVSSPSSFRRDVIPSFLATLPKSGTLIIYSYFVTDY